MIRAVFDTNVLLSALLFGGLPARILEFAFLGRFKLVTSPILIEELVEKLRDKFRLSESRIARAEMDLNAIWDIVSTTEFLKVVKADPDDDRVIECAVVGRADYIVTGDRHLLAFGEFRGIAIVTVRQFMDILNPPA
jgi:putative PIN family toxin of toxin-antitoxin system